jgi:hypothetical protein
VRTTSEAQPRPARLWTQRGAALLLVAGLLLGLVATTAAPAEAQAQPNDLSSLRLTYYDSNGTGTLALASQGPDPASGGLALAVVVTNANGVVLQGSGVARRIAPDELMLAFAVADERGTATFYTGRLLSGVDGWSAQGRLLNVQNLSSSDQWSARSVTPLSNSGAGQYQSRTVTTSDDGQTVLARVGDQLVLDLAGGAAWTFSVDDPTILGRLVNVVPPAGADAVFTARRPGPATLQASGEPSCRQAQPACSTPSKSFRITVAVSAATGATPAPAP